MTLENIKSFEIRKDDDNNNSAKSQSSQEFFKPVVGSEVDLSESSAKWRRIGILVALAYTNFFVAASISVQAPFFPREAELKGATSTQYGLVFGIYELVVIIVSPILGKMIPRVTPKVLITSGTLLGGISCAFFGVLDVVPAGRLYIALAFIVRIIEGIGAAALFTATFVILAAEFPDAVGTSFSIIETAFGLGMIIGPIIGGLLFEVGGFMFPFIVIGFLEILGCALLAYILPKCEGKNLDTTRNFFEFLCDGGILCFGLSIMSCFAFIGFTDVTLEPFARKFHLSPTILGLLFMVQGGSYALTTFIWGYLCDKGTNPLYINLLGYSLTCLGIVFIAPVPFIPFKATLWTIIISLLIAGLGLSAKLVTSFTGALQNTLRRGFPDNLATYGMVSAYLSTVTSIGGFIGPSLGGVLIEIMSYANGTVVVLASEICCMLLLVIYLIFSHHRSDTKKQNENTFLLKP